VIKYRKRCTAFGPRKLITNFDHLHFFDKLKQLSTIGTKALNGTPGIGFIQAKAG
jgi:hypothetical protein